VTRRRVERAPVLLGREESLAWGADDREAGGGDLLRAPVVELRGRRAAPEGDEEGIGTSP
jgi:hypothetical protein